MNFQQFKTSCISLLSLPIALLIAACGSDSVPALMEEQMEEQTEVSMQATLNDIQATVFTPGCSSCHSGGGTGLPAAMDLTSAEASFSALVSVPSLNEPDFERVTPSNPDASYLIIKLEGRQNVGAQMPRGAAPLNTEVIASIRQWIASGAAP